MYRHLFQTIGYRLSNFKICSHPHTQIMVAISFTFIVVPPILKKLKCISYIETSMQMEDYNADSRILWSMFGFLACSDSRDKPLPSTETVSTDLEKLRVFSIKANLSSNMSTNLQNSLQKTSNLLMCKRQKHSPSLKEKNSIPRTSMN